MFVMLAFVDDKFVMDAVVTETLPKEALVDSCNVLLIFLILALVDDKFIIEAVEMETLLKDALLDS